MKKQVDETLLTVERILKAHKGTRDSDKALILEYMFSQTGLISMPAEIMNRIVKAVYTQMPAFETITRCRRKIQSTGRYLGSMQTQSLRKAKSKAMKQMFK